MPQLITLTLLLRQYQHVSSCGEIAAQEDQANSVRDAYNGFIQYFDRKRVWLPDDCCRHVEELRAAMLHAFVLFDTYRNKGKFAPEHVHQDKHKAWSSASVVGGPESRMP